MKSFKLIQKYMRLTFHVVSQALDFSGRLKNNRLQAHAAASLEILLPRGLHFIFA
jgi:hypothetical protein